MDAPDFEWDAAKDAANQDRHGVAFARAQHAFLDPRRFGAGYWRKGRQMYEQRTD